MNANDKKLSNEELKNVTGGQTDQVGMGNEAPEGWFGGPAKPKE